MKHLIIPLFIMNRGCPNRCVFCNERITAGDFDPAVEAPVFRHTVESHLAGGRGRFDRVQVAFYGGNFTGLDLGNQQELLDLVQPYLERKEVDSIRLSTRPDHIDEPGLRFLKARGVRTIEIGAQSMNDEVLRLAGRGHDAAAVRRSVTLLKEEGFETGIHLMAGLPGDNKERFLEGVDEIIGLAPDTVRIHPTIVLRGTILEKWYKEGRYHPLTLDEAVDLCAAALLRFKSAGIPVIRLGLHITDEMRESSNVVAGPLHPAFRSLAEEKLFLDAALELLKTIPPDAVEVRFSTSPRDLSLFKGTRKRNMDALAKIRPGFTVTVDADPSLPRDTLKITVDRGRHERALGLPEILRAK
ncbi:MAG TPA: radical SAM protein [Deltaproteobacteria bacterium]|nr:radical SAM protein [Deltaproteobacteria bacterium]